MRFLLLTQYYHPEIGAAQVRLHSVAITLQRLGHDVEVVTAMPNHPGGRILHKYRGRFCCHEMCEGVAVRRVWLYASTGSGLKRVLNYTSFAVTSLWGLLQAKKPDFIFVESPPLLLSVPAYLASRIWRRPIIFNVADIWPDAAEQLGVLSNKRLIKVAQRLEHWSYSIAKYVTTVTDVFADTLSSQKGVPREKLLFLPNGVDTEMLRPQEPDRHLADQLEVKGKKVFLYAGTHGYAHAMEMALEAAKLVQEQDPHIHFLFVGDGSEKAKLIRMAQGLKLQNVTFRDPVPIAEIAQLYSISVAGLSTLRSTYNTRPVKILAAMACGKPIVYCGKGEGAQLVDQAKAGVISPPDRPEELAHAVCRLANNPILAAQLGANGRRYVTDNLSWKKLVADWLRRLGANK